MTPAVAIPPAPAGAGTAEARAGAGVAVVGVGSVLTGDDALGPTAVALLRAGRELPDSVYLLDAGTPGSDLASHVAGRRATLPPGEGRRRP